ncbi:hypothetical protein [Frankia sp. KB5]|uniref:hypothetical protein n=1 Tax=Frankia sp. KB5 TaxID=683318 RepID=UPI000A104A6B|nr:hypothetical protein [Frankia sp. KB5]ORT53017.1 hypothetical protein KBI5_08625 [Frankia sp. KB5]ORT53060.1 hypothetical protein KBI5_08610 [Frankia sp. KB5]
MIDLHSYTTASGGQMLPQELVVPHPGHDTQARRELRELAATLGLLPIGGSGYHGHGDRLGAAATSLAVYKRLVAQAHGDTPIRR